MTQTVSAREIKAAGGLQKWKEKAAQAPAQSHSPKRKEDEIDKYRNLSILPLAKGRRPKNRRVGYEADRMNETETKYAELLETQRRAGEILFWRYESVKFRLADRTWYTPDFYIMRPDGTIEIHETKGWMEDDANVKIKSVAEKYPEFKVVLVKLVKGKWEYKIYRDYGRKAV